MAREKNDRAGLDVGIAGGAVVTTPSDCEVVITRSFAASRRVVFDAWTKPEQVAQWWDPAGTPLAICEIDLRPNGAFRFVHQSDGGRAHQFSGTYREVKPPLRLVFTTPSASGVESVGTLVFTEHAGSTALTMTIACQTKAERDALLRMRVDVGTVKTLDNLAEYLRSRPAAS